MYFLECMKGLRTILELFKAARSFSQGTALAVSKDSLESDSWLVVYVFIDRL